MNNVFDFRLYAGFKKKRVAKKYLNYFWKDRKYFQNILTTFTDVNPVGVELIGCNGRSKVKEAFADYCYIGRAKVLNDVNFLFEDGTVCSLRECGIWLPK